jgi:hypothetical protein
MEALPLGDISATPWSLGPLWFCAMALATPAIVWLALAWRRALLECPNRVRRAGVKEMRRLLRKMQRSDQAPRPAHLHAWLRATARVWDVRTAAPCESEVTEAAHALTGDPNETTRWRDLWQTTEHGLYAPEGRPAQDWLERAANAAASVAMPKRERWFPNRLAHWLPSVGLSLFVFTLGALVAPPQTDADVPWSAQEPTPSAEPAAPPSTAESASAEASSPAEESPPAELTLEDGLAAQAALKANWNDWAAHRNLAVVLTQRGDLTLAIAHATAAFVQHPAAASTRDTLLAAYGETPGVDANLRRLLSGAWYERIPTLLSPAGWQKLSLAAALIVAATLSAMIFARYVPKLRSFTLPTSHAASALRFGTAAPATYWSWAGRGALAVGALLMIVSVTSWNAYGAMSRPSAAILIQNANATPTPTDLVPVEETSPLAAGAVVLAERRFLSWQQVRSERPDVAGWIRDNAVMPLYSRP